MRRSIHNRVRLLSPCPILELTLLRVVRAGAAQGVSGRSISLANVSMEPPEKQQHHSCSDDMVFIMMDSPAEASSAPMAKESPTLSLVKVALSSSWG